MKDDPDWQITSDQTNTYNCFAWAANDKSRPWDIKKGYWPSGCARLVTVEGFVSAFGTIGFSSEETDLPSDRVERIAIFALDERAVHAARQLENGLWTSKLGDSYDICHRLESLANHPDYGQVSVILEKPRLPED